MQSGNIQEIRLGAERAVIVPLKTWEMLLEQLEEAEDQGIIERMKADPDQDSIEYDELCRELGMCPLRYLRHQAEMTQTELARRTRLSQSFIAKVEAGDKRLSASSRKKIARALKLPESKLIY